MKELGIHVKKKVNLLLYVIHKNKFQEDQRSKCHHMRISSSSWEMSYKKVLSIEKKMHVLGQIKI